MKTLNEIADDLIHLVGENEGRKSYTAASLAQTAFESYGGKIDKGFIKEAIRNLISTGRLVHTYFGGSSLKIPPDRGEPD